MNNILTNFTYCSLEIIRALRIIFSRLILLLVLGITIACNQENTDSSNTTYEVDFSINSSLQKVESKFLKLNAQEGLVYHNDKPFNGSAISYYPNNEQLAESIDYINGMKHGYYKKWFEDGTLSFESIYVNGKRHGITKSWWRNKNLRSEANYKEGVVDGLQMQWYKSGAKFKRLQLVDGKEEGLQQSWRENGKIYNNYEAKNGRIFGLKRANLCYALEDEKVVLSQ